MSKKKNAVKLNKRKERRRPELISRFSTGLRGRYLLRITKKKVNEKRLIYILMFRIM